MRLRRSHPVDIESEQWKEAKENFGVKMEKEREWEKIFQVQNNFASEIFSEHCGEEFLKKNAYSAFRRKFLCAIMLFTSFHAYHY